MHGPDTTLLSVPRLGVNVDHVATIRQARGIDEPDPVAAAVLAQQAGADGITIHLREDRRHIQERDVRVMRGFVRHMNLELAAAPDVVAIALDVAPQACCLVPERREEVTTEGGLDCTQDPARIAAVVEQLAGAGSRVSLFIDPDVKQLRAAVEARAVCVELHTGRYADAKDERARAAALGELRMATQAGRELGLEIHAGHGLNYRNVAAVAAIPGIAELNIGHSIVARRPAAHAARRRRPPGNGREMTAVNPSNRAAGELPAGVWTALVTPFRDDADRSLDFDALEALVERQIAAGVSTLVPCGTTGESPTLSHREHDQVVEFVVEKAAGRVPVVAGTGSNSTREALRLTRHAAECGADGALIVCPYYNRPSQRMLRSHFDRLAEASTIPIVLYNVPSRTGVDLLPETVAALRRDHATIVAIKEASGSAARVAVLRNASDIAVISGDDALTLPMISLGACGVISVASNALPAQVVGYVTAALAGDFETARTGHERLHVLFRELFREPNPVPVKRALALLGEGNGVVREPLLPATAETGEVLAALLSELRG